MAGEKKAPKALDRAGLVISVKPHVPGGSINICIAKTGHGTLIDEL
jgi:hypothetical protein